MSIGNHAYTLIDFDFVELLRSASSVLRLPRPQGERRTEPPIYRGELGAAKINLLPPRLRVAASAEQGWGWGK